jgi:SAM-dependent methyltransferase/uncharacterized protein YbaR (Trm112 family)
MTKNYQALFDLLICPVTGGGNFHLEGSADEGVLKSDTGSVYPIIGGVARMLPPDLLGPFLRGAFPDFLDRWPQVAAAVLNTPDPDADVLDTLASYSYQHVDMADDELLRDDWYATWCRFQPGLEPADFARKTVLEVGSGEGRHTALVGEHAALMVGLDLSRGVEIAHRRDVNINSFYVQGDLRRPPFRKGVFDALYSNGVIHHTPEPSQSFAAVAPLVRVGGEVYIWVYGLDDMRWSYRMSHLTFVRPLTNRLPRVGQLGVAAGLTALAEIGLWTPSRLMRGVGFHELADRVPYADAADKTWQYKLRRMFDCINPPITHYITKSELADWFGSFQAVEIINADGQGWSARGVVNATEFECDVAP